MTILKSLVLILAFCAACVAPSSAQVAWSNHSPAGVTDAIWCVTYANGTFAAVTDQGNLLTSGDGLTWDTRAIDPGVWLVSIAYGEGVWVAVGDKGAILVSPDLKNWTSAASPTANRLNGVLWVSSVYVGNYFVAVGEAGTILASPDGTHWTAQVSTVSTSLHGITNDNKYYFDICGENGVILQGEPVTSATSLNISQFNPYLVATTQYLEAILVPTSTLPAPSVYWPYPYAPVAVGDGGTVIAEGYSLGTADIWYWFDATTPSTSVTFRGLAFGSGGYVAAGDQGTLLSSTDGYTWTQRFAGDSPASVTTATLLSATYAEPLQRFVVTGAGGTVLVSDAAPTVFGNVSTRGVVSSTQTLIGGFYISGTSARTILIRADGPALGAFSVPSPLPDPVLTVFDSAGAVVATNTGWTTSGNTSALSAAAERVGAFTLPNPSLDAALLLTLQPGAYTVQVTSKGDNSGTALFEAYTD